METENQTKQIEIIHAGDYDLIVDKSALSIAENGLLLKIKQDIEDHKEPLFDWYHHDGRFADDKLSNPDFIAKTRWFSVDAFRSKWIKGSFPFGRDRAMAHASLLNEFSLASKVKAIVESSETQDFCRRKGYLGIKLVEPILGIINRKTQAKIVIYKYIKGREFEKKDRNDYVREGGVDICNQVHLILKLGGVQAHDLNVDQFIVEETPEGKMIYLLDIEGYVGEKTKQETSKKPV